MDNRKKISNDGFCHFSFRVFLNSTIIIIYFQYKKRLPFSAKKSFQPKQFLGNLKFSTKVKRTFQDDLLGTMLASASVCIMFIPKSLKHSRFSFSKVTVWTKLEEKGISGVVSKTKHSKTKTEARSTLDRKRRTPKSRKRSTLDRKRSTQISKTKTPKLENEAPESGGGSGCVRTSKGPQNPS